MQKTETIITEAFEIAEDLKSRFFSMPDGELLKMAIEIQKVQAIQRGFAELIKAHNVKKTGEC